MQISSEVGLDEPIFQPFPPQITFYNIEVDKPQEALLYLRNNDKVSVVISATPRLALRLAKLIQP